MQRGYLAVAPLFAELRFGDELRFAQIVAVEVHDLAPRGYEVLREDLLRVGRCVDFRDGAKLRVGTEDQVNTSGGPLDLPCRTV